MDKIKYDLYSMVIYNKRADINRKKAKQQLINKGLDPIKADVIIKDFEHRFKDGDMTFADVGKYLKKILQEVEQKMKGSEKNS